MTCQSHVPSSLLFVYFARCISCTVFNTRLRSVYQRQLDVGRMLGPRISNTDDQRRTLHRIWDRIRGGGHVYLNQLLQRARHAVWEMSEGIPIGCPACKKSLISGASKASKLKKACSL
ncbi:uncharacterized protein VDAG_07717 [Verticillium dahliae VdLs.17]|uniref:Uncharacterized protein n=1 Tax=Verticillium dahliae (strain VdLs.17 / ATCC MYA-4575 / FGSC 10137) TaxID=498257 RepID=G2XBT1_VERDV|nr:uncharacterized protein VDAG_07717 [Verticillium dahliae VdLs.17]EGY16553.1 hypothetical protein VDAG_07717 [Verticillium dahliae VdLs.17]